MSDTADPRPGTIADPEREQIQAELTAIETIAADTGRPLEDVARELAGTFPPSPLRRSLYAARFHEIGQVQPIDAEQSAGQAAYDHWQALRRTNPFHAEAFRSSNAAVMAGRK